MFPLHDENPTVRSAIATLVIIAINLGVWIFLQGLGSPTTLARSICTFGLIPGDLLQLVPRGTLVPLSDEVRCVLDGTVSLVTPLTSMFMHGGWFHLIGNLWFLWVFGDNVEDAMGALRFVFFYLSCGLAAAATQVLTDPSSAVPMVGASGAIGGVMGGYVRLYPRARIYTLVILGFFITTLSVPAFAMLGYWFLLQLLGGLPALGGTEGGVAFWAHIGGFLAGFLLVGPFHRPSYLTAHRAQTPRRTARHRW
nr:rhomboid family intramembrane serine protease [Gammaproteobacteria bacterium]